MSAVARLVFPALRWRRRTGFRHERAKIERTLKLGVGGYIFFGGNAEAARPLIRDLRTAAPHPLLFGADVERGAAQQFDDLIHLPPPAALGFVGRDDLTARSSAVTAREARYAGLNWVYAPVADLDVEPNNPIIQTRSFGDEPERVSAQVAAWVRAAEAEGVATSAKHYPGHGRTTADSHETLPAVNAGLGVLEAEDLKPFRAAIAAGTRSVMVAHVAYPGWDTSGSPASLSAPVLAYLRREMGFSGVIVTDALIMEGALRGRGAGGASVAAVAAGCDALLYPQDAAVVTAALEAAAGKTISWTRLDDALGRIARLAEALPPPLDAAPDLKDDAAFADALADMAVHVLRGDSLSLRAPLDITVVDDDVGGPYTVGPRDLLQKRLAQEGIALGPGGSRVVLIYAEPRSWKGRALLGANSLVALGKSVPGAALTLLFGHPRLELQIPGTAPVVCAWHGQPLMQYAAARWVISRLR